MRKLASSLLVVALCLTCSLQALDLSGAIHVDTYTGKPTVGFSFLAQENIAKWMSMRAQADYLAAQSYDVQALVLGEISRFTLGGGIALGIQSDATPPIVPGISLLFGLQATRHLDIETAAVLTFTPENLGKLHDLRARIDFLYKTENTDSLIGYTLRKGIATDDFINTLKLEVEAFGPGIPVGLIIGSEIDLLLVSPGIGIDVDVIGGLLVITGKYGTYFAKAKIGVLSHKEGIGIPYDIAVGARFSL